MGWNVPVSIHIVVERELLVFEDFAFGEDTHTNFVSNIPFGDIAVGVTAVVRESANVAFLGGVDVLSQKSQYMRLEPCQLAYLFFLKHHEVEMAYALLRVPTHALQEFVLFHHLPNILVNEGVSVRL